jgi:hypothetical protein
MVQIITNSNWWGWVWLYKYKGSVDYYADLPTSWMKVWDTYNVVNAFTKDGKDYPAWTNVAWTGTDWDALWWSIDLSDYQKKLVEWNGIDLDQDTNEISVESTVINWAALWATAVQPWDLKQADWGQSDSSAIDYIKNKPTIPTVNNSTIEIQKNGTKVEDFTLNQASGETINITVPTDTSDLTNWAGFVTSSIISDTAYGSWWNWVTATAPSQNAVYDKISAMDTTISWKLDKLEYEFNKSINFYASWYLKIGSFPMYDSNVTINIDSTSNKTYHWTVVIATQNTSTTSMWSTHKVEVYDDPTWEIASALRVVWTSWSRNYDVYFVPSAWSKNLIHIRALVWWTPTDVCINQSWTAPTTTTWLEPVNMLDKKQDKLVSGTNIKSVNGNSLLWNGNLVLHSGITASLTVAGWSSNTQTVTVPWVTASNYVIVSPAPASITDYTDAKIYCSAQWSNSLTFTCDSVPSSAITVNVVILN